MSERLTGLGILVTRPRAQSGELSAALTAAGGNVYRLPVIEISPQSANTILRQLTALPAPDIIIYVSRNAAYYGAKIIQEHRQARVAAIGPATRSALEEAGVGVDISSVTGFDSEQLLDHDALAEIAGQQILIVRGQSGRELLADTLRQRGASVNYLAVYERTTATPDHGFLDQLVETWRNGGIHAVIVMSVESLTSLLKILPTDAHSLLWQSRLVTPSKRVIQTATDRMPGVQPILADSPRISSLVRAIVENPT